MRLGSASTTVTGTVTPASVKTRVMPHLRPTRPMVIVNPHIRGALEGSAVQQAGGLDARDPSTLGSAGLLPVRIPWIAGVGAHALRPQNWTAEYTGLWGQYKLWPPGRRPSRRGGQFSRSGSATMLHCVIIRRAAARR